MITTLNFQVNFAYLIACNLLNFLIVLVLVLCVLFHTVSEICRRENEEKDVYLN